LRTSNVETSFNSAGIEGDPTVVWSAPQVSGIIKSESTPSPLPLLAWEVSALLRASDASLMSRTTTGILTEIIAHKRAEVETLRSHSASLERSALAVIGTRRPFADSLRIHSPAIIAEIKKASPSKGLLQSNFHAADIARTYQEGGATCVSVLTDRDFFQGGLEDLRAARAAISLPVLRKDFTIDPIQILEAAAEGADAILLIANVLSGSELRTLRELAETFGLAVLVEVHDEEELSKATDSGAKIIGVNNRNLETFEVTLETSLRLAEYLPAEAIRVSESGIHSRADIARLQAAGFHAFLVGESLMRASNPAEALRALIGTGL
jgi:indole-3-glycerol phosphate synthase